MLYLAILWGCNVLLSTTEEINQEMPRGSKAARHFV